MVDNDTTSIRCPQCESEAVYRYGRTWNKKQRYLCLVCGRQFVLDPERVSLKTKPNCPACGQPMHIYRRYPLVIRFRCSDYPDCRHYLKISLKRGMCHNELLHAPGAWPTPHQIAVD